MAGPRSGNKKPNKGPSPIITFPKLHDQICSAISEGDDLKPRWIERGIANSQVHSQEYSTNIMGIFRCANNTCSVQGWGSKVVAIVIRGYTNDGYNAEVFKQRCQGCNQLGILKLHEKSYIDRVTYRIKTWAGVKVERPPYNDKKKPIPHERELCEGCKHGYCQEYSRLRKSDNYLLTGSGLA
ncbi:3CxxC-type zinc finger protein [Microdochium nivale]|nr:3CxxC-type zinc finger protein [Microdochium nivale]